MNPSTSVYNFVFMVVTYALAPAVTSLVTAALGKSKPARAGAAIRTALLLSAVGGCVLAAALQAAFPTLLQVMGCGAEAMPAAVAYSVGRGWVRIPVCPCARVRLCRWPFGLETNRRAWEQAVLLSPPPTRESSGRTEVWFGLGTSQQGPFNARTVRARVRPTNPKFSVSRSLHSQAAPNVCPVD